ncbi:hypothetical protein [Brevibacillus ruminantium]|uniref:hypothetical protein n=1 Tax=Brevibacillus ruminantium TaxID=2950604 RepID=UPI0038994457
MAQMVGARYAVAFTNGTAALHAPGCRNRLGKGAADVCSCVNSLSDSVDKER